VQRVTNDQGSALEKPFEHDRLIRARCEASMLVPERREDEASEIAKAVVNDIKKMFSFDPMQRIVFDSLILSNRLGSGDAFGAHQRFA